MKTSEVLREARKRIERGWTTGELARDSLGARVDPSSSEAVCWCSYGAIDAVTESGVSSEYAIDYLAIAAGNDAIAEWNDRSSRNTVIAAFDRAIALAESRGD